MEIVWVVLYCIGLLTGLVATAFGLPGTFVVVLSVLVAGISTGFAVASVWLVLALAVVAALTEVGDATLSAWAVKRYQGTGRGQIGAVFMGLVGAVLGGGVTSVLATVGVVVGPWVALAIFIVGPIVGGCLGGFVGAVLGEMSQGRTRREAIQAGWGALVGRTLGTLGKVVICTVMVGIAAWQVVPALLHLGEAAL